MHIVFFVEDLSAEAALNNLVPKIIPGLVLENDFKVISFQCKQDLQKNIGSRLKAYRRRIAEDWRIVVLIDKDLDDCLILKQELEQIASDSGFTTRTMARGDCCVSAKNRHNFQKTIDRSKLRSRHDQNIAASTKTGKKFQILNRIAVEELESWFFGDIQALTNAFPGVPSTLPAKSRYRDPDSIKGGTWEAMERELQKAGYFQGGLAKVKAARAISEKMDPERNVSQSFKVFRDGLRDLAKQ